MYFVCLYYYDLILNATHLGLIFSVLYALSSLIIDNIVDNQYRLRFGRVSQHAFICIERV